MTHFIRLMDEPTSWRTALAEGIDESQLKSWMLADFTPSIADNGGLSVYRVDFNDNDQVLRVVSAIAASIQSFDKRKGWVVLGASIASLDAAGIDYKHTKGTTSHTVVDDLHFDISVTSAEDVALIARHFISSDRALHFESGQVADFARRDVRADLFDFAPMAKQKPSGGLSTFAIKVVGERVAAIRGIPLT